MCSPTVKSSQVSLVVRAAPVSSDARSVPFALETQALAARAGV
jgi:hypothetical protein